MTRAAVLLFVVLMSDVVWAQARSSANAVQKGGSPNVTSLLVGLVPADTLALTGEVDSNSTAVWDLVGGRSTMVVLTSFAGRPSRAQGSLSALTPAMPVAITPWPGGGVYVMLLNRAADESFSQEGIYCLHERESRRSLDLVRADKIMDGGQWYPQVIGMEEGAGTDKLAGREARFFVGGRSSYVIRFNRLEQ